jgi:MFS family permease
VVEPARRSHGVLALLLLAAVGLAFADASVVTLALPDLYATFHTTVVGVSWVLTTYALVVAVAAVPLALASRRLRPLPVTLVGLALFGAASLAAGLAPSLAALLVARAGQGIGATLLLAGSLPVLGVLCGSAERGRARWATAATVGAAVGPALGGIVTQFLAWRAIFLIQAPVAILALVVALAPGARALRTEGRRSTRVTRRTLVANAGFALVFASLVGALFLGVLLAVEVWGYSPIEGALIVSGVPLGMLLVRPAEVLAGRMRALAGCACLAGGLLGLALVPGDGPVLAVFAFILCGAGFELVSGVLAPAAIPTGPSAMRTSSISIGARHAGLVLGLVVLAPVLATSLDNGIQRAVLSGTSTLLDARISTQEKVAIAWSLRDGMESTKQGDVPDLAEVFAKVGHSQALATARDDLTTTMQDAITRAFRPAFAIAAGFGALALIPALVVVEERRRRRSLAGWPMVALLCAGVPLLIGAELAAGARDVGEYRAADACTAAPDPYPGSGMDATIQRIALSTINGAACDLHVSREYLLLSLDRKSGYGGITWNEATTEKALKAGAHRAIDDAEHRGTLPGWAGSVLGFVADHAPMNWFVGKLPFVTN